jgi:hypothetical protein
MLFLTLTSPEFCADSKAILRRSLETAFGRENVHVTFIRAEPGGTPGSLQIEVSDTRTESNAQENVALMNHALNEACQDDNGPSHIREAHVFCRQSGGYERLTIKTLARAT